MRKVFFLLAGMALIGCEEFFEQDVNVNIPDHEEKLVLYSYATPGDSLIILLTNSVGVEVPANLWELWISNAQVEVVKNETETIPVIVDTSDEFFPFFVAHAELNSGDHIAITAASEGYESIYSEVTIPDDPTIENANYAGRRVNIEGEEFAAFNFEIIDEIDVENFYEVSIVASRTDEFGETYEHLPAWNYDSNLTWINPPSDDGFNLRLFFEDAAFENSQTTVEFLANVWELANPEYYSPDNNTEYYLSVKSVSKGYYDFVRAFGAHQDNQFPDLFSGEPVPLPSNIENGFGVFGAYSATRIKIDLGDLDD